MRSWGFLESLYSKLLDGVIAVLEAYQVFLE